MLHALFSIHLLGALPLICISCSPVLQIWYSPLLRLLGLVYSLQKLSLMRDTVSAGRHWTTLRRTATVLCAS